MFSENFDKPEQKFMKMFGYKSKSNHEI